jgi:hypothetical protein
MHLTVYFATYDNAFAADLTKDQFQLQLWSFQSDKAGKRNCSPTL